MSEAETIKAQAASETRHKLANVFQLLTTLTRMRIQRSKDDEARRQLSWMLDATSALALLNRRPRGDEPADFSTFLAEMAPQWRKRCADRPIDIQVDLEPVAVPERQEAALALIAHELVVNAIAHAFPDDCGVIRVSLRRGEDETAVLTVSDDGCGYDAQAVDRSRLGLWLIGGLASQVQGF